jgi:hypothetical protein
LTWEKVVQNKCTEALAKSLHLVAAVGSEKLIPGHTSQELPGRSTTRQINYQANQLPGKSTTRQINYQADQLPGRSTTRQVNYQANRLPGNSATRQYYQAYLLDSYKYLNYLEEPWKRDGPEVSLEKVHTWKD